MDVLGIGAWTSPGAACLVRDGRIVAAAREDRYTRRPEDPDFPRQAIEYCLRAGKIGPSGLTRIVVAGEPLYPEARSGGRSLLRRLLPGRGSDDRTAERMVREIAPDTATVSMTPAEAHARAAFAMSGFDRAAVLAFGRRGAVIARGTDAGLEILEPEADAGDPGALLARARELTGCGALAVGGHGAGSAALIRTVTRAGTFDRLWFQPAGAAATAIGAALEPAGGGTVGRPLGPSYNAHEVRTFLRSRSAEPEEIRDDVASAIPPMLDGEKRVGWFAGRLEFAEQAPASRSVLSLPGPAPSPDGLLAVPAERAGELLGADDRVTSPLAPSSGDGPDAPLVFRADREEHRALHALLRALEATGRAPVLECRPLAAPGGPLACTPRDAFEIAEKGGLDALVMERYVVRPRP